MKQAFVILTIIASMVFLSLTLHAKDCVSEAKQHSKDWIEGTCTKGNHVSYRVDKKQGVWVCTSGLGTGRNPDPNIALNNACGCR